LVGKEDLGDLVGKEVKDLEGNEVTGGGEGESVMRAPSRRSNPPYLVLIRANSAALTVVREGSWARLKWSSSPSIEWS
jgi:hypothetical protein